MRGLRQVQETVKQPSRLLCCADGLTGEGILCNITGEGGAKGPFGYSCTIIFFPLDAWVILSRTMSSYGRRSSFVKETG